MIGAMFLLFMFYVFMTLFTYAGLHSAYGYSKPKSIAGGILWPITGLIYLGVKLVKAMERDKCQK